jgi:hypothetical protein
MSEDERKAVLANLARYRDLLSGTLDPMTLAGYEYLIKQCDEKLAAMDRASGAKT